MINLNCKAHIEEMRRTADGSQLTSPAMYFSNYPREVRELAGCGSPTTSQQFTQTQPQPSQTQETQTQPLAHPATAHTGGSKGSISSKATQSSSAESSSKATQSDASACCSEGSGAEQTSQDSKKLHAFPGIFIALFFYQMS